MCMSCGSLFVLLSFFFWPLCCLFFFDIRILIAPLISSNSSYHMLAGMDEDNKSYEKLRNTFCPMTWFDYHKNLHKSMIIIFSITYTMSSYELERKKCYSMKLKSVFFVITVCYLLLKHNICNFGNGRVTICMEDIHIDCT